ANRIRMLFVLAFMAFAMPVAAQNGTITGRVTDQAGNGINAVEVSAIAASGEAVSKATSNETGSFRITNVPPGRYAVQARRIGYGVRTAQNVNVGAGASASIDIRLSTNITSLETVVTAVGKHEEKVIDAPASVSVVSSEQVNERPSINVVDHVTALPGIDVARGGLMRANVVARGFNNIFSGALMTLTDNRFAFVPSLRVNIPYLSTTTNEDIERIEVVLGPGAALYGPNTASGVMALFTKNPFTSAGTTVTVDAGNQDVLRGSLRSAWVLSPKFAVKGAIEGFKGTEWDFCDGSASLGASGEPCEGVPADTVGEKKPRDRDLKRYAGEVRMDFRPTPASEIIANYGRSQAIKAVEPTGLGPAQVKDWIYQTYQLRARYNRLFGQVFMNTSDAGGTYLLQTVGSNTNCPAVADLSCIIDLSRQFAAQVQHGFDLGSRQRFLYGLDYINTEPRTKGTINGRNEDDDKISEIGGYVHSVTTLSRMFEVTAAARVDKHSRLDEAVFSPRLALVFKPVENQNFRLTYNRAFSTPSTNNLFLDRLASRTALLDIRALGTPDTGFQFRRDCPTGIGGLCMRALPAFGGSAAAPFVAANPYANSFATARAGIVAALTQSFTAQFIAAGLPPANAAAQAALVANGTAQFLASRTPTAEQVGTTLVIPGVPGASAFVVTPAQVLDIDAPKPTIHSTIEAGYKGIIGNRLQLSIDVWHEQRKNFVGPLQLETPLVFMNGNALGAYLGAQLAGFFPTIGIPASAAATVAALLAGSLPGSNPTAACSGAAPAGCPIGVVNFDTPNAGNDVIVAYRSYNKSLNLLGTDLGAELLLDAGFSVQGTYSWVNKKLFSKARLGTREDVSLNAPAQKHSFAVHYRGLDNGWAGEIRERHVDAFNTLAFVGGPVAAYTLLDAGISYRPDFLRGALIAVNGTNILDKRHREFTQGNLVGRLILTRLQMMF
ncbi:MAG: TonB-dependent receptor, partial [Gemmatimonadales bacterium]